MEIRFFAKIYDANKLQLTILVYNAHWLFVMMINKYDEWLNVDMDYM